MHPGFIDLVRGWWEAQEVCGPPGQRFCLKLKGLRENLRIWNKDVFGNIQTKKTYCLEKIQCWDRLEEEGELDEDQRNSRKADREEYDRILAMEEVMCHQKSRVQWLKECDNNTRFFHKMASARRATNGIHSLLIGDVLVQNEEDIKNHVKDFFRNQYSNDRPSKPKVDGLSLLELGEGQAE